MGTSVFEIIGPVMTGPSSSHTAGMARIGMMAHRVIGGEVCAIRLDLSPKLRTTYHGHRTDAALIGGVMGFSENDTGLRDAIQIARSRGIGLSVDFLPEGEYPQNTAKITVIRADGQSYSVTGTSVGGGSVVISQVDAAPIRLSADAYHLVVWSGSDLFAGAVPKGVDAQTGTGENGTVTCMTFVSRPPDETVSTLQKMPGVTKVSLVEPILEYGVSLPDHKTPGSCEEVCAKAAEEHISLAEAAIRYEMGRSGFSREKILERMGRHLAQMKQSVEQGRKENQLLYGLASGKDARLLSAAAAAGKTISGGIVPQAVAMALGVMEYNGSMGCIVAAPTAGSSGIVPGCMAAVQQKYGFSDEKLVDALFVSALMGIIMTERNVSFSGSVGGCQGEVGVSSAIAAAGLVSLFSDDPEVIVHAMALCLKNLLGLVCDPIAGPIEIPCIKRNAVGVANAFISADMALAGIRSFIPPDEVIDALVDVETRLPPELKCATVGGLACTPTAMRVREQLSANT